MLFFLRALGMAWEADFWRLAVSVLHGEEDDALDSRFDLAMSSTLYRQHQLDRARLRASRAAAAAAAGGSGQGGRTQRRKVADLLICLGRTEEAVRLLLDAEADSTHVS